MRRFMRYVYIYTYRFASDQETTRNSFAKYEPASIDDHGAMNYRFLAGHARLIPLSSLFPLTDVGPAALNWTV